MFLIASGLITQACIQHSLCVLFFEALGGRCTLLGAFVLLSPSPLRSLVTVLLLPHGAWEVCRGRVRVLIEECEE